MDLRLPLAAHLRPPAGLCVLGLLSTRKPRAGNQRTPSTTTAYFMLMTRCITAQGDITDAASNYSSRRFPAITGIHLQPKNTNAHVLFLFFFGPHNPHIFAPSLICGFTVKPLLQCNTTQRRLACGGVCWCQKRCLLCLHFFQAAIRSARLSPAM